MRTSMAIVALLITSSTSHGDPIRLFLGGFTNGAGYIVEHTIYAIQDNPPEDNWQNGSPPNPTMIPLWSRTIDWNELSLTGPLFEFVPATDTMRSVFNHPGRVQTYLRRPGNSGGTFVTFPWAEEGANWSTHYAQPWDFDPDWTAESSALTGNTTLPPQWSIVGIEIVAAFDHSDLGNDIIATLLLEPMPDYDRNGTVDESDYLYWQRDFGMSVTAGNGADGNNDGIVDAADYVIWRKSYQSGVADSYKPISVPEVSAVTLLAVGSTLLISFGGRTAIGKFNDAD